MERRIVIGDIHGCIQTFRHLVEDRLKIQKCDTLFLAGDYIDRGPDSKAVIEYIMKLQRESCRVIPLMGNHEYLLLHAMESTEYFKLWMLNSGYTTLNDFGIDAATYQGPAAIFQIPGPCLDFFRTLRFYAETPGFFITHGCFEGRTENPLDDINSMVWRRVESYNADFLNGRKLIHGHTPVPAEEIRQRVADPESLVINLDAGCVYHKNPHLGQLAALDLDSWELYTVKNCG